jgi:hypothetical protein
MRLDIDGLRGANPSLHSRQAGGNWATRYEKAGSIGMMAPADEGNAGEISRGGGLTAGQTAHEALSFRQFDQSGHPRAFRVIFRRPTRLARRKAATMISQPIRQTPASMCGGSAESTENDNE